MQDTTTKPQLFFLFLLRASICSDVSDSVKDGGQLGGGGVVYMRTKHMGKHLFIISHGPQYALWS